MKRLIIWLTMSVWAITAQGQNFAQISKPNPHYFATSDGKTYVPDFTRSIIVKLYTD